MVKRRLGKRKWEYLIKPFIVLKFLSVVVCFLIVTAGPASSFFGNECKKPKATYESYLSSAQNLKAKEDKARLAAKAKAERDYAECQRNPRAFLDARNLDRKVYPRVKASCAWWKISYGGTPTIIGQKTSYSEYKNAMLVVSNYKKCFDPAVYIEAKKWLEANK